MDLANLADSEAFTTLDGSTIREVAGRRSLPSAHQSLAEPLTLLCCCAPAYSDEDTVLLDAA